MAGAAVALFQPLFEDQPAFGMAGRGVGVVLIYLQPALIHTEIHTTGNHMMASALPREAQARPENFRNIEQRQQAVILHYLVGGVQVHQMQLVGGLDKLLLGAFGDGEILVRVFIDDVAVGFHVGFLQRIFLVEPVAAVLAFIRQPRAFDGHRLTRQHRLRQAVLGIGGLNHPAEDFGIGKGVFNRVDAVFHFQRQLSGPLLALRQRRVNHVLLGNPDLIAYQLRNHRHVASVLKLAAFLPDQQ